LYAAVITVLLLCIV